jgi:hypothetical protein
MCLFLGKVHVSAVFTLDVVLLNEAVNAIVSHPVPIW